MSTRFLLDTNVLCEALKATPDETVLAQLERHAEQVATASVVWHELVFGVARLPKGKRKTFAERYLHQVVAANLPVLAYHATAAAWHAQERARLEALGRPAPFVDGQIAAIAVVNGLTLVTGNARDFAAFRELRVVDWRQ